MIFSKAAEAGVVLFEALLWINGLLLLLFIKVPSVKDKRGCERGQHPKSRCSVLKQTDYPPRIIVGHIQPACLSYIMNVTKPPVQNKKESVPLEIDQNVPVFWKPVLCLKSDQDSSVSGGHDGG